MKFQVSEDFLIDDQPVKLISGAVHYFRIVPTHWKRTLMNLQAMGCNCVETYIPWNLHEPRNGEFNFSGLADIESFLDIAQDLGLYIILRPSPYICAEWDFGGLPAWLLQDSSMRIRSQYAPYIEAVKDYYNVLIPKLVPYQYTRGGNVLMMQIENEYGSYGEDKNYLKILRNTLRELEVDVPLFTSDGGWDEVLNAGTLPDTDVFPTANFGSDATTNFDALERFMKKHNITAPLMCMEFWDGWFNGWQQPIIRRSAQDAGEALSDILERGSVNFYMFQGGTNFGFYNGCSDMGEHNIPQITSYDYDAPITEWGAPTEKYYEFQRIIGEKVQNVKTSPPILPTPVSIGSYTVTENVSLFSVLDLLTNGIKCDYTKPMESFGQNLGYILYRSTMAGKREVEKFRLVDANDRAQIFINEEHVSTKYLDGLVEPISFHLPNEENQLDILVENMARNNYGPKLVADTQRKGIRSGVIDDIHYISDWEHYTLDFEDISVIDFSMKSDKSAPSFYRSSFHLDKVEDTFLDCSKYGKGVVFVNGVNMGRYWSDGPVVSLFIPDYFWKIGQNEVVIFETEGTEILELDFMSEPKYTTN